MVRYMLELLKDCKVIDTYIIKANDEELAEKRIKEKVYIYNNEYDYINVYKLCTEYKKIKTICKNGDVVE